MCPVVAGWPPGKYPGPAASIAARSPAPSTEKPLDPAAYREAAVAVWDFIETRVADRVHGEWHAKLGADGQPRRPEQDADVCLAGPWKCPYHNSRACFEMMARLGG